MWALRITIFLINVLGQAMQNICLPLALSDGDDMAVVFIYTAFIYFCFFSMLDVVLDLFTSYDRPTLNIKELLTVSIQNTLNGIGAIFGGSSTRTPLTMQMSGSLLVNLMAPFYKMWVFNIKPKKILTRQMLWYLLACLLYGTAFVLTLVDKLRHVASGTLSPYAVLFLGGIFFWCDV